jgi:HEAT repeat protein
VLARLLRDPDTKTAALAAEVVPEVRAFAQPLVQDLLGLLLRNDGAPYAAAHALASLGPSGARALAQALNDPRRKVRMATLDALESMGQVASFAEPQVAGLLNHEDSGTRAAALVVFVAGRGGPLLAEPQILYGLSDADSDVRWTSLQILRAAPRPLPARLAARVNQLVSDEDELVREGAQELTGAVDGQGKR